MMGTERRLGKGKAMRLALALAMPLALLLVLLFAIYVAKAETFPGLFEVIPACLSLGTCGQGPNLTVDGVGILNMMAAPANGINDGFVTGVLSNVTWFTTTNGTDPYPLNSSVWRKFSNGTQVLLVQNATVSENHLIQIGPFSYSPDTCPPSGCQMEIFVKSCNTTTSICVNSTAQANGTITPVVGPAMFSPALSPASPRTGDVVNATWNTRAAMNATLYWGAGSAGNATMAFNHSATSAAFNATQNVSFVMGSCLNGACENQTINATIGFSASGVSFSTTAPTTNITASWTTHMSSNSTLFYALNGGPIQNASDGLFSASHSVYLGSFNVSDVLVYYTSSCLLPNNCEQVSNSSQTIAVPVTTTSTSSGGGPGDVRIPPSNRTVIPADADVSYRQVPVNAQVSFGFNASRQAITTILFSYRQFIANATIYIVKLNLGNFTPAPPGMLYQYDNVTHEKILDSQIIPPVRLDFRVTKAWIRDNNIDVSTIALFRFSGGSWQPLETTAAGENATYYYFRSSSPGLSLFAITGQQRTAFWDIISLIERYYNREPGVDFWRVLDALTSYYAANSN